MTSRLRAFLFAGSALLSVVGASIATPANAAAGNRLRLIYIRPGNPSFPDTQTVSFGAKTRVSAGQSPMGYRNPQLLAQPLNGKWLAITQIVDGSSVSLCSDVTSCKANTGTGGVVIPFWLDERFLLAPANGTTHTYEAQWTAAINGPYAVTVAEYSDSGFTSPTGAQTVITVPIVANAATVRENTGTGVAWGGCATVLCPTSGNRDGGSATFNGETNQLDAIFKLTPSNAGHLCLGDTVYARDAGNTAVSPTKFNPNQQQYYIRPPTAGYTCGAGRITVVSETIDASTDSNGNPALKNGFRFGGGIVFNVNDILAAPYALPIDMTSLYCYEDQTVASGSPNECYGYNTTAATSGGVGFSSTRFEVTVDPLRTEQFGISLYGPAVVTNNHFIGTGITVRGQNGGLTATGNVGEALLDDFFSIGGSNNDLEGNFEFNPQSRAGNHQDFIQYTACVSPIAGPITTCNGLIEKNNILVLNQLPLAFTTSTGSLTLSPAKVTFTTNPGTLVSGEVLTGTGVTTATLSAPVQWNGTQASATVSVGQNVASRTLTLWPNDVPQFLFSANPTAGNQGTVAGADIANNLGISLARNLITYSYFNNASFRYNLVLSATNMSDPTFTSPLSGFISLQTANATSTIITDNGDGTGLATFGGSVSPGTLGLGETLTGGGVAAGTKITSVIQQWASNSGVITPGKATVSIGQTVGPATVTVAQSACCDVTSTNNVANGGAFTGQEGTTTETNRVTLAWTGTGVTDFPIYQKAMPAWANGPSMAITNRAAAILMAAPGYQVTVASGGLWNADHSYSGPYTPPDSGGHPCVNTGLTNFDNTKTCAQQSLTPAT